MDPNNNKSIKFSGKQLKALASPEDPALFDKVISTTSETTTAPMTTPKKSFGRRSSLLDKMLAKDYEIGSHTANRRPGLVLSIVRALDNVGLDIQQAVISYFSMGLP
ncbi:hypothetical protein T459_21306 [Capsicum annuum]|uniref:Uncharacterized protein n=1 Tax=Capsicum annuum TaxID=4072 RepID=A0A2G2YWB4_CAPAN|nr:hypothetical protein T459_21306 [Capsicum annuum]